MIIGLDFGHGFGDSGAIGNGFREDEEVRKIGEKVKTLLESNGHKAIICSIDGGLTSRANYANKNNVDLYVSIHLNSATPSAKGTEVFVFNSSSKAMPAAKRVLENICSLGYVNRGIKTANFVVLKATAMPSMLIECCFISNANDMANLNYDKMAQAIAEGIINDKIVNIPPQSEKPVAGASKVYRIYKDGVQQGTAYSHKENILNIVKEALESSPNEIKIQVK